MNNIFTLKNGKLKIAFFTLCVLFFNIPSTSWAQTYCTPSGGTVATNYITGFSTANGVNNLLNANSGLSPSGYGDFTDLDTISQVSTYDVNINATLNGTSAGVKVWVDWNQDGDFDDPGEEVYVSSTNSTNIGFILTVPLTATIGTTRLRIGSKSGTATGPSGPCETGVNGEFEDYSFEVLPLESCVTLGVPSAVTILASKDTLCFEGDFDLELDTAIVASGITYQWQSSIDGVTWTNEGTPQLIPEISFTNVDETTLYRCQVLCENSIVLFSDPIEITVVEPVLLTAPQDVTRCGPGTVNLTASASSPAVVNWYGQALGGTALGTGNNFTTPYVTSTTDFWASAFIDGASSGSDSLGFHPMPSNTCCINFHMFVVETGPNDLILERFYVRSTDAVNALTSWDIYYRPDNYQNVPGANTSNVGWTLLTSVTGVPSMGTNEYTLVDDNLTLPLTANSSYSFHIAPVSGTIGYQSGVTTGAVVLSNADLSFIGGHRGTLFSCATTGGIPTVQLGYSFGGCESPREKVTVTVTPPTTPVSVSYDSILCNNEITSIAVASSLSAYSNYSWTPRTGLYTDAAATQAYTGGSASTVYFRSNESGYHNFYLSATNGPNPADCADADTVNIWVQPGSVSILASPDTICVSGTSQLTLDPEEFYHPSGLVQWQNSDDNSVYNDIFGADQPIFTTPSFSYPDSMYYKAVIRNGKNTVCETTGEKIIRSADPILVYWNNDTSRCGPGRMTLQAIAEGNSKPHWYDSPQGGNLLWQGSVFQTDHLTATTNFYVGASAGGGGGGALDSLAIPLATGNTTGIPHHMFLVEALEAFTIEEISTKVSDAVGTVTAWEIYYRPDNYQTVPGANTSAVGWILAGSSNNVLSLGGNDYTLIGTDLNISIPAGQTYSIYIAPITGGQSYSSPAIGTITASNSLMNLRAGNRGSSLFSVTTSGGMPTVKLAYSTGCESSTREKIEVVVLPAPSVELGGNVVKCVDSGYFEILDAENPGSEYEWNTGYTNRVLAVDQSGYYSVKVTNEYDCIDTSFINLTLNPNPVIELSDDTLVCFNVPVTINAGNGGVEYFWNTGQVGPEITVNRSGIYKVNVTTDKGCHGSDSIQVIQDGELPSLEGIQVTNNGGYTFMFNAINPQNIKGMQWDFGDGRRQSYDSVPIHTYLAQGNYMVTLKTSSTCGTAIDSTPVHITTGVGIDDRINDKHLVDVYPNPSSGKVTITTKEDLKIESVEVVNILGQVILKEKVENTQIHSLQLNVASGMYHVRIQTSKGVVIRKIEVLK